MSSIFTMPATTPYTATVMTTATTRRISRRGTNGWSATSLRAITMISAERMKSVRMAPVTMKRSASSPEAAAGVSCAGCPRSLPSTFSAPS